MSPLRQPLFEKRLAELVLFKQKSNNEISQIKTSCYVAHIIYIQYLSTAINNINYV